jgi:hypothetical protein
VAQGLKEGLKGIIKQLLISLKTAISRVMFNEIRKALNAKF